MLVLVKMQTAGDGGEDLMMRNRPWQGQRAAGWGPAGEGVGAGEGLCVSRVAGEGEGAQQKSVYPDNVNAVREGPLAPSPSPPLASSFSPLYPYSFYFPLTSITFPFPLLPFPFSCPLSS